MRCTAMAMLLACGCVLTPQGDYQSQISYHGYVERDGKIVPVDVSVGMTSNEVVKLIGPPQAVNQGRYNLRWYSRFAGVRPGIHTMEMAWARGSDVLIAYVDDGVVRVLGMLPRAEAMR